MAGSPRTGSTWLAGLLCHHQRVAMTNEPLIGAHLGMPTTTVFGADPLLDLDTPEDRIIDRFGETNSYFFSEQHRDSWEEPLRALLLARLSSELQRLGGTVGEDLLIVKEPNGSEGIDIICDVLPESRLLVLVRDGRDVVDSMLDGVREGGWANSIATLEQTPDAESRFRDAFARLWVRRTRSALDALEQHEGDLGMLMRYEDLLADPERALRRIFSWLGLCPPEDIAELTEERSFESIPEEMRGSGKFYRTAQPGLWREHFGDETVEKLTEIMASTLDELGYAA